MVIFMNARIKLSARAALAGTQLKIAALVTAAMVLIFVFSLCNAAINTFWQTDERLVLIAFSAVTLLLFVAAVSPLRLLLEIKHLLLAKRIKPMRRINMGASGALKACALCVYNFFLKLFWFAAFEFVPFCGAFVFASYAENRAVSLKAAYAVFAGLAVLAVAGLFFWLVFIQRYSKSMFYLACYKDLTASEAIGESIRKTRGRLVEIFLFKFSFAPWLLLCAAVVPALFVIPYYKQSITCYFLNSR